MAGERRVSCPVVFRGVCPHPWAPDRGRFRGLGWCSRAPGCSPTPSGSSRCLLPPRWGTEMWFLMRGQSDPGAVICADFKDLSNVALSRKLVFLHLCEKSSSGAVSIKRNAETSLLVWRLALRLSTAGGTGLIPGLRSTCLICSMTKKKKR